MDISIILILITASIAGSGLIYLATKKGAQKKLDYQAFAQSQGWVYETPDSPSRIVINRFRDPRDNWTLDIIFRGDGAHDGTTEHRVEWRCPDGKLDDGEAVLGMPIPEKSVAMLQMGGPMGQQILIAALKATYHALGKTKFDLAIDEATAGDPGGAVMSTDGQAKAMDALRRNQDLAQFRKTHKTSEVPVLIRDETGVTLRRPGAVKHLDDLSKLVDLGISLRADLG